jgi:hypothetical protein
VGVPVALGGWTVSLAAPTLAVGEGGGATEGFGPGSVERDAIELDCDAVTDADFDTSIGGSVDAAVRGGAGVALGGRADGPTEVGADRTADGGAKAVTGADWDATVDARPDDGSGGRTNTP